MKKGLGRAVFFILMTFLSVTCLAQPIKQLVFFGDSLSDNGNLYKYDLHIVPKSPPYSHGQFSNGNVWDVNLASYLKLDITNSSQYLNLAYGGADAENKGIIPSIPSQVGFYLSHYKPEQNTLVFIWGGANDYLDAETSTDIDQLTTQTVNSIRTQAENLLAAGVKNLAIVNLPDLGKTVRAQHSSDIHYAQIETNISNMHNNKLQEVVGDLQARYKGNAKIMLMDVSIMFDTIIHSPQFKTDESCYTGKYWLDHGQASYPLPERISYNNISVPVQDNPSLRVAYEAGMNQNSQVCSNPDQYVFWDSIHPTAIIHQILAQDVLAVLYQYGYTSCPL